MSESDTPIIPHTEPAIGGGEASAAPQPNPFLRVLKVLGPGFITDASDDDPSGIGTYNYIDDDIAQVLGRLRYMQVVVERVEAGFQEDGQSADHRCLLYLACHRLFCSAICLVRNIPPRWPGNPVSCLSQLAASLSSLIQGFVRRNRLIVDRPQAVKVWLGI
jgi:hypothetical protein